MRHNFQPTYRSKLWRAIYIVCMVVVYFYILFDVLDLDGSDFPFKVNSAGRSVFVLEVPKVAEGAYLPDQLELRGDILNLFPTRSGESLQYHQLEDVRTSPLDSARAHGYRVALPRASIESSSLSA